MNSITGKIKQVRRAGGYNWLTVDDTDMRWHVDAASQTWMLMQHHLSGEPVTVGYQQQGDDNVAYSIVRNPTALELPNRRIYLGNTRPGFRQ